MIPMLGDYSLAAWQATVCERQQVEGGRLTRRVVIRGAADGFASAALLDAALDGLVGATAGAVPPLLRIRPGRVMPVRLQGFTRDRRPGAAAGAFTLELEGLAAFEEGESAQTATAAVSGAGVVATLAPAGTLHTPLTVSFTASGSVMLPRFDDGNHELLYSGVVPHGATLVLDGGARQAWLDGEEATSQVSGAYLTVGPPSTVIGFSIDGEGWPSGTLTLSWHDRWL